MNPNLFHALESKNIYFKSLSLDDVQEIHGYASDKDVKRFIGWNLMHHLDETREHVETMINRELAGTHLYASVVLRSTQEIIGTIMLFNFDKEANHAEIGYVFHKEHWGKGYGTESVALTTDFAFKTLKLHKVNARVTDANIGSAKVLDKNGYVMEGQLKDQYFIEGKYFDSLLFGKIDRYALKSVH
jgi:[ribosomal protein S5]-alanine N-acetyltransferase